MAHKKLKLLYLARYLQERTDEEHPASVGDMIAYLAAVGIPAERKAIYDDLELLRTFGMDIVHVHGKTHGYYLGQREFELPELKLLIDVVQASPFLTAKKSMELIGKLEGLASAAQATSLRRQVYVLNRVKTHNEQLYYNIDGINQAIRDDRQIRFRYFDWAVDGGRQYRRAGTYYQETPVALCVVSTLSSALGVSCCRQARAAPDRRRPYVSAMAWAWAQVERSGTAGPEAIISRGSPKMSLSTML